MLFLTDAKYEDYGKVKWTRRHPPIAAVFYFGVYRRCWIVDKEKQRP